MKTRWLALALGLVLFGTLPAGAQDDFASVEIGSEKVAEGIYMLTGRGGNLGLSVGEDGAFLIDDQFAPLTGKILAAVEGLTPEPVRFLVNTHWHGDHTGGNENMGQAGAYIVAHENVRERLAEGLSAPGRETPPAPEEALPVVTFTDVVSFHWNGEEIRVFFVGPAHTDGDAVIHFSKADVFHMGDTFFNGSYPFVDVSSGGRLEGIIDAADRVLKVASAATRIIPGHGPLADRADLQAYRDMLVKVRDRLAGFKADGKTVDEAVAAKPTADLDEKWGGGFMNAERFVSLAYESMQ